MVLLKNDKAFYLHKNKSQYVEFGVIIRKYLCLEITIFRTKVDLLYDRKEEI